MSTEIIVALVTSIFTFAGVVITVVWGNKLTEYRIKQLEAKQDKHNSLIERMYLAEDRLNLLDERTNSNTHRIDNLENQKGDK
jgi:hypothetical protein